MVCHNKLEELLSVCPMCAGHSAVEVDKSRGAHVFFTTTCLSCNHSRTWSNGDRVGRTSLLNILVCAGILFTGSLPTKVLRFLLLLNIKAPNPRMFHHYQKNYLHGMSNSLVHSGSNAFGQYIQTKPNGFR